MPRTKTGLNYTGISESNPPQLHFTERDPDTTDVRYELGDIWINRVNDTVFQLTNKIGSVATWAKVNNEIFVPSSSTVHALVRFDGTTGNSLQNSVGILTDAGALSGLTQLDVDNIRIDGNNILSSDANGDLTLTPDGTGDLILDGLKWPQADGALNQILSTNGAGQTFWSASGSGDVIGPAGATDHAIVRFDTATGKLLQNSGIIISDTDVMTDIVDLGIGTSTVPHGAVGSAKVAIDGTDSSPSAGPHVQVTTSVDNYPLMQFWYFAHDDMGIYYDCYVDGSSVSISSDIGSNFRLNKNSDNFGIDVDEGIAAGSPITWSRTFQINKFGQITTQRQSNVLAEVSAQVSDVTGDGTVYTVIFNNAITDVNSDYNTGTGIFTAPVTGTYDVDVIVRTSDIRTGNNGGLLDIVTSNRTYEVELLNPRAVNYGAQNAYAFSGSIKADMDASDTLRIDLQISNGLLVVEVDTLSYLAVRLSG